MGLAQMGAATLVRRLAASLNAPAIIAHGEAAATALAGVEHVTDELEPSAGAVLAVDVSSSPASVAAVASAASAVVLVAAGQDAAADRSRWSQTGAEVWRGATVGLPTAVAVLEPGTGSRVRELLSGGPYGLLFDLETADVEPDLAGVRVAFVTYELVGLTRTGGIGTANTALAHALAEAGAHVDVLFTGWLSEGVDFDEVAAEHARSGVHVSAMEPAGPRLRTPSEHLRRAHVALHWLQARHEEQPYDVIHVPECAGHGAAITAAKRAGEAFHGATVVTGTHGSSRWVREINGEPVAAPEQLMLGALERRSVEDADVVVSPSAYLAQDMLRRGWRLPERTFVQQYVLPPAAREEAVRHEVPFEELVFFGRLETRKGFLLFLDALDLLVDRADAGLAVTFLGRPDLVGGRLASEVIEERRSAWPWKVQVLADLDQPQALAYLRGAGRLAVMPSLADNLPLTVVEGLALGIPFVTCATGGIPEIMDAADLARFATEPEPVALADRLLQMLGSAPPAPPRFAVDTEANRLAHLRWHRAAAARAAERESVEAPREDGQTASVVVLGSGHALPANPEAYVLFVSPRHELDEGAATRLVAAARTAQADIVTFTARTADGALRGVLGGPPALVPTAPVLSTGSALVRRALVDSPPADEQELEALLAAEVVAGRRLLALPAPAVMERVEPGDAVDEDHWLLGWWPDAGQIADAEATRARLEPAEPQILRDLPAVARLASLRARELESPLAERTARIAELEAVLAERAAALERVTALWHDARDTLERRDRELAETVAWANEIDEERRQLHALQSRRLVRAASKVSDARARISAR